MPSKKQEFTFQGQTAEQLLLISYGTFLELGWTPKYAGPFAIAGYTPRSWKKYEDEILLEAADGSLTITSSLIHNESFDLLGKNKKHINDFITAFEKVKTAGIKDEWVQELEKLRDQTTETATEQIKQAEEVNAVMNLAGSNLYITYGIIAINVIVFILMAFNGAGIFEINSDVHVKWGSNITIKTMTGEWWRLITNIFIHFGVIHLIMNAYALYTAGVYLEPMLGKTKYIVAYLCTGVIASIVSLWWHKAGVNSAGASGAIFGLYGVFLALLLSNLIPKQVRSGLLQSIGIFVVFNLVYGMKAGIDNAAHIGGLISGLLIGFVFYLEMSGKISVRKPAITILIVILTILGTKYFLSDYKSDAVRVDHLYKEFFVLQDTALQALRESNSLDDAKRKDKLVKSVLPAWKKNLDNLNEMESLSMTEGMKTEHHNLRYYVQLRIEEAELLIKVADAPRGTYDKEMKENNEKIEAALKKNN